MAACVARGGRGAPDASAGRMRGACRA
ncbi:MAG: hypothetical protein AVDCRST_MAG11-1631, partial [uncultured Gemmatimonadaceae bacterium]